MNLDSLTTLLKVIYVQGIYLPHEKKQLSITNHYSYYALIPRRVLTNMRPSIAFHQYNYPYYIMKEDFDKLALLHSHSESELNNELVKQLYEEFKIDNPGYIPIAYHTVV